MPALIEFKVVEGGRYGKTALDRRRDLQALLRDRLGVGNDDIFFENAVINTASEDLYRLVERGLFDHEDAKLSSLKSNALNRIVTANAVYSSFPEMSPDLIVPLINYVDFLLHFGVSTKDLSQDLKECIDDLNNDLRDVEIELTGSPIENPEKMLDVEVICQSILEKINFLLDEELSEYVFPIIRKGFSVESQDFYITCLANFVPPEARDQTGECLRAMMEVAKTGRMQSISSLFEAAKSELAVSAVKLQLDANSVEADRESDRKADSKTENKGEQENNAQQISELVAQTRKELTTQSRPQPLNPDEMKELANVARKHPWRGAREPLTAAQFIEKHFADWLSNRRLSLRALKSLTPSYKRLAAAYSTGMNRDIVLEGLYVEPRKPKRRQPSP